MKMIETRNLTSHAYNESVAAQIAEAVCQLYYKEFEALRETMQEIEAEEMSR